MLQLIAQPIKNIGTSSTESRFSNVHQFTEFRLRRRDFEIATVTNDSGKVKLSFTTAFTASDFALNKQVKLVTNITAYNGVWDVFAITGTTSITLDLPYIGGATGYLNTYARVNFYASMRVSVVQTNGTTVIAGVIDAKEEIYRDILAFNVAPLIKPYVLSNDRFNYVPFAFADIYESNIFTVEYNVNWFGHHSEYEPINEFFYFINAVNQVRYRSNSNMEGFMYGNSSNLAKYLSAFEQPTVFKGYPFCMSWIHTPIGRKEFVVQFETYGVNVETTTVTSNAYYLTRTLLDGLGAYGTTDVVDVQLKTYNGVTYGNYSEVKRVKIDNECRRNGVYLNWLGTDGSRNFWLFDRVQTITMDSESTGDFEPFVRDLGTQQGDVLDIGRTRRNKIVLTTYCTIEDAKGIASLLANINTLMLVNPETWETDGVIWESVRVQTGSYSLYNTNETHTNITITIERVGTNIQSR